MILVDISSQDLIRFGKFVFRTIYTNAVGKFGKQFTEWCTAHRMHHVVFGPTTGKKTRLGIVERFNRNLKELYFSHIKSIPRNDLNHYFTPVIPQFLNM